MASELKVDKVTGVTTAGSIDVTGEGNSTTTNLQQGLIKSWCNFNGQGTIATRDTFNVASLTDNGTGLYQTNFSNNMNNTDYSALVTSKKASTNGRIGVTALDYYNNTTNPLSTDNTRVQFSGTGDSAGITTDVSHCCTGILGDLA